MLCVFYVYVHSVSIIILNILVFSFLWYREALTVIGTLPFSTELTGQLFACKLVVLPPADLLPC